MTQQPEKNIDQLAAQANTVVSEKQAKAEAAIRKATTPRNYITRYLLGWILPFLFLGLLFYQYPRFIEPYGAPDPAREINVAKADIEGLADAINVYRIASGRLPDTLDAINLPPEIKTFIQESGIQYAHDPDKFSLNWQLPKWKVVYDSANREVKTESING